MSTSLYRHYDQVGLDAQLNLRARWPEHEGYFERWARDSARVRAERSCRLDLAYGESAGERLDLFLPPDREAAALLIFIHGGYWQSLDKSDFSYLAPAYLDSGIAFASLNYDLAPAAPVERMVDQVYRALAWLFESAEDLGFDRTKLYVSGHSAGGHLAAMTLVEGWQDALDLPADLVKGVCAVSGVYELAAIQLSYHQAILQLNPEVLPRISPLRRTPSGRGTLICAVGDEETQEFRTQQAELLAAWRRTGQAVREIDLVGRNHFTAVDAMAEQDHLLFVTLKDLILAHS